MNVVWGAPVDSFVAAHCNIQCDFGNHQTAGVFDGQKLVAGVIFRNFSPEYGVMEVTAAAIDSRWASRTVLRQLFGYVFNAAQLCVARTGTDNQRVRRLWKAFGAKEYIIPRLRGREASEAILTLTDDAWYASRFMRQANGQIKSASAA